MTFTVINASAGSGKTFTLTHEIADRIRGGLQPSQLIATTFTSRAAAELSDRVRRTLLEEGLLEAARGTDSALIGTVNSVFGQLLREFALDAGISPEVRVLDAERQKDAFRAAVDEATAAARDRASGLLARTEHDGEEEGDARFAQRPSWLAHVRELAAAARTNLIGADRLREAAELTWEEYREEALPAPGEDRRAAWLDGVDLALDGLRADRAVAEDPSASAELPPSVLTSIVAASKKIPELEQLHRALEDPARAPWSAWAKLAKAAEPGVKGGIFVKNVVEALAGVAAEVADPARGLLALPALQEDARGLITLVMHTAADSLDAYEQYKRNLGLIDFVDQEAGTLRLLQNSERARAAVRARFRLLAVDEFQDTSPIQLALFLELSRLIRDKIWVGDPQQAIYGFRDADPALMLSVTELIEKGAAELGPGQVRDLEHSWRSQEQVLDLVSAVFPRVFPELPRERVVITAAPGAVARRAREGRAAGRLEAWIPDSPRRRPTIGEHAAAVAEGVVQLLQEPGVEAADMAVLVRTNTRRAQVVEALAARGVRASGEGTPILASREGRIVRAALAVTLDLDDTLALTELVDLLPDHAAHDSWLGDLAAAADVTERAGIFSAWWRDPVFAGLRELRGTCISLTPVEMVTALVDALDLPERMRSWSTPEHRLRTLDALRALAAEYADAARSASEPITLAGLRRELDASDRGPDLTDTPGTVWVGTIHGAKGLEWSHVVVMAEAEAAPRSQTAGSFVVPASELDITRPLAGRSPRYWPQLLPTCAPLQEPLGASAHARRRRRAEREESGRLQYVALTRAKDVTVLSGNGRAPALDALIEHEGDGEPLLSWEAGAQHLHVAGAGSLPAVIRSLRVEVPEEDPGGPMRSPLAATDLPTDAAAAHAVPARFRASAAASAEELGRVGTPRRIGPAIVDRGGKDWDRVGEAVHAYLALPLTDLTTQQREQTARRLVERWSVARAVGAQALLRAGEAWRSFLDTAFPGAEVLNEQPIAWWNEDGQAMEGWIDSLLRLPDGRIVLIDHKAYPGDDPVAHVRTHYLGQLDTYARALAAAGSPPDAVLVHLPLRGEVLEVTLHDGREREPR